MTRVKEVLGKFNQIEESSKGPYMSLVDVVAKDPYYTAAERGFINFALQKMDQGEDEDDAMDEAISLANKERGAAKNIRISALEKFFQEQNLGRFA